MRPQMQHGKRALAIQQRAQPDFRECGIRETLSLERAVTELDAWTGLPLHLEPCNGTVNDVAQLVRHGRQSVVARDSAGQPEAAHSQCLRTLDSSCDGSRSRAPCERYRARVSRVR